MFDEAPFSLSYPIDLARQRESHLQSFSTSWLDGLCYSCRHHNTGRISPLSIVDGICEHFPAFARGLRNRHDGRPTVDMQDEYDVQDALYSLLALLFDDVRQKEWTPNYAGSSIVWIFFLRRRRLS